MIHKLRVKKLKREAESERGVALIAVVCLMCLFVTMSLALLLSSSVLVKNSLRAHKEDQCRISAITFSEIIKNKIETQAGRSCTLIENNQNLNLPDTIRYWYEHGWIPYDIDAPSPASYRDMTLTPDIGEASDLVGDFEIRFYWETDEIYDKNRVSEYHYFNQIMKPTMFVVVSCKYDDFEYRQTTQLSLDEDLTENEQPYVWGWSYSWTGAN